MRCAIYHRAPLLLALLGCHPLPVCDADTIRSQAERHGVQTAFAPCGTNDLRWFAWSGDGKRLLYALSDEAYVLEDGRATPIGSPSGPGGWWGDRIVLPVGASEHGARLLVVDDRGTLEWVDLPGLSDPIDFASDGSFVAVRNGRRVVRGVDGGAPLPWAEGLTIERYDRSGDAVAIGAGGTVTLYDAVGIAQGSWPGAVRGTLHPGGRWLALEAADGTLSVADRVTGARWALTGIQGTGFQWYAPRDVYASVLLSGFDGAPAHPNVVLGDLAPLLRSAERGAPLPGIAPFR